VRRLPSRASQRKGDIAAIGFSSIAASFCQATARSWPARAPPWEEHGTYIDRQKEEVCGSLAKNWRAIEAVAEALLQRNQLTGIEVEAILAGCSPRRDPEAG